MGLKRKNPARTRLLTTVDVLAAKAEVAPPPQAEVVIEPKIEATPPTPVAVPPPRRLSSEERHQMIARVAYGYAERAGFRSDPVSDWLTAEREIDATLTATAPS